MKFEKKEVDIISQTLTVPLMAFGYDELKGKIGGEQMGRVKLILDQLRQSGVVNREDLSFLIIVLLYSRDIIDWIEYPTLTGFTWGESTDLIIKIIKNLQ